MDHEGIREKELEEADRRRRAHSLSQEIIGAALRVHSALGPGLLESAYEACLTMNFVKQVTK